MSFDFDPIYVIYALVAASAVVVLWSMIHTSLNMREEIMIWSRSGL